jgi:hypothetical protein
MFSDDESFAGTASEFLEIRNTSQSDDAPETDDFVDPQSRQTYADDSQDAGATATATDDDVAEGDDDSLSADDRVAAVFGLEAADDEEDVETPDGEAVGATSEDLQNLSQEELLAMAEEYLKLKAETTNRDVDAETQALAAEISELDQQTVDVIEQQFEQEVVLKGETHYGNLRREAGIKLRAAGRQRGLDGDELDAFFDQNIERVHAPINRAQRVWEQEKTGEWEPRIEAAIIEARKQHPKLRQRFAETLCTHRIDAQGNLEPRTQPLPKKAAEEILKITNTDDMPIFAQSLEDAITTRNRENRANRQQRRTDAAKTVSREAVQPPAQGRRPAKKPVELKGTADEWLSMNKRAKSTFSRV